MCTRALKDLRVDLQETRTDAESAKTELRTLTHGSASRERALMKVALLLAAVIAVVIAGLVQTVLKNGGF